MSSPEILRLDALAATPLVTDPFEYVVVPEFVSATAFEAAHRDFPRVAKGGSWPIDGLTYGAGFAAIVAALESPELRAVIGAKFGLDLSDKPTMITVRGQGRTKDGGIHTDSLDKVITLLIYLNRDWPHAGGRLRLLRNGTDLNNFADEVAPIRGNLIIFRRSDHSWHGHLPAEDQRLSLQMNWMIDQASRDSELKRHKRSALLKRLLPIGG